MFANRMIVEVIRKDGLVKRFSGVFDAPRDMCDLHADLWKAVGRMPVACFLADGEARVIFQSGRRASDPLDSLEDLVEAALKGEE